MELEDWLSYSLVFIGMEGMEEDGDVDEKLINCRIKEKLVEFSTRGGEVSATEDFPLKKH